MNKKLIHIINCLTLLVVSSLCFETSCQELNIKNIPNPKMTCQACYVANPDGVLSQATVDSINAKLSNLESETSAQIAVVVIRGDKTTQVRNLSTDLFDLWKVGAKGKDNGAILILAVEARNCFIRTGYGLEGALTDAKATRIVSNMAPKLKKGEWDEGIMDGVTAIYDIVLKEYHTNGFAEPSDGFNKENVMTFLLIYLLISFALLVFSIVKISKGISIFSNNQKEEKLRRLNSMSSSYVILNCLFIPSLIVLLIWIYVYLYRKIRLSPVVCSCSSTMFRLSEVQEDEFLSQKQQLEETLKSKDYDVWLCNCSNVAIYSYNRAITSYSACPFCGAKTFFLAENTVLSPATFSDGIGRKTFRCKHCDKTQISDYRIPKSVGGSYAGGSSFGGGSGGGFSGGFGGGSSGGGGGGGRF